jgi:hypothetical protein
MLGIETAECIAECVAIMMMSPYYGYYGKANVLQPQAAT